MLFKFCNKMFNIKNYEIVRVFLTKIVKNFYQIYYKKGRIKKVFTLY